MSAGVPLWRYAALLAITLLLLPGCRDHGGGPVVVSAREVLTAYLVAVLEAGWAAAEAQRSLLAGEAADAVGPNLAVRKRFHAFLPEGDAVTHPRRRPSSTAATGSGRRTASPCSAPCCPSCGPRTGRACKPRCPA
ncbi:MAG: hypothetical protein ABIJ48_01120 [Actinomycetota bacterium]